MRGVLFVLTGILLGIFAGAGKGQEIGSQSMPLRIGVAKSFFHDMTEPLIQTVTEPFINIMRDTSGVTGELAVGTDPLTVARQLQGDKLHLGVFFGFEYAWVRQQHPELKPLMIAVNGKEEYRAVIVVRKDNSVASFADLKGKGLALPKRTSDASRRFLEKESREAGAASAKEFFGRIVLADNVETALDELSRGKFDAVATDALGLGFYKDLKPGVAAKLTVLARSEPFPPLVIAYHQGALSDAILVRVRDSLRKANEIEDGREMMRRWKITAFEPVPADLDQKLQVSIKAYPIPEVKAKTP